VEGGAGGEGGGEEREGKFVAEIILSRPRCRASAHFFSTSSCAPSKSTNLMPRAAPRPSEKNADSGYAMNFTKILNN
jgi:hypothetical protein